MIEKYQTPEEAAREIVRQSCDPGWTESILAREIARIQIATLEELDRRAINALPLDYDEMVHTMIAELRAILAPACDEVCNA